jgi:hypothetical protein
MTIPLTNPYRCHYWLWISHPSLLDTGSSSSRAMGTITLFSRVWILGECERMWGWTLQCHTFILHSHFRFVLAFSDSLLPGSGLNYAEENLIGSCQIRQLNHVRCTQNKADEDGWMSVAHLLSVLDAFIMAVTDGPRKLALKMSTRNEIYNNDDICTLDFFIYNKFIYLC